jgi:Flp pilus assembly protein TadB
MREIESDKGIQLECQGRAPELIGYMAMSIRLSPSLTRAITFAARNMDGPISSGLKRILWKVYMRKYHSVEESFTATATEWGKENEDLKRGLFAVRSSTLEASDEGRERDLDKAMDTVLSGTKKRMEEFASSLSTPTTVLFALGILLPMILGAMLPMISLGGLDLSYRDAGSGTLGQGGGVSPILVVLMMDVIFPTVAFVYAASILTRRPGSTSSLRVERRVIWNRRLVIVVASSFILLVLGGLSPGALRHYMIIWSFALPSSVYLIVATSGNRKENREIKRMEEEFPDALFQLGTRISEGSPPERAMLEVDNSMRDARISDLFREVHYRTIVFGLTLEKALFGETGLLADFPSPTISATMKSLIEIAAKDPIKAGKMIIKTAEHLKDLQRLEEESRRKMRTSTESMRMTALFFAPIVMGVTYSLYGLLVHTFSQVGASEGLMAPSSFLIVLGVYIVLMCAVAMNFVTTIEKGPDRMETGYSIGRGIVVAMGVFTISSILGQYAIT